MTTNSAFHVLQKNGKESKEDLISRFISLNLNGFVHTERRLIQEEIIFEEIRSTSSPFTDIPDTDVVVS